MSERVTARTTEAKREVKAPQRQKSEFSEVSSSQSVDSPADQILFLQRTIGNRAVERLIRSGALQAKLKIGQPGDRYEQEADRVAERVMRMPEPSVSKSTAVSEKTGYNPVQRRCPKCTANRLKEEEEVLQPKEVPGLIPEVAPGLETDINAIRGGGQPLPESVRAFFEPRFGYDFSHVRMHVDAGAAEAARAVNARAFTVGRDVVFGEGEYEPEVSEGQRLLAHELTHVVQQTEIDNQIQRDIKKEENIDEAIEKLLQAGSFETKWENFVSYTDSMMRSMFAETPAYYDLASGGSGFDTLYELDKQKALALADDLVLHFEQNDVDAFRYGMDFAKRLDFLKEKEKATHARELYQKGWQFMSYLRRPEDTDIAVDYNPQKSPPAVELPLPKGKQLVNMPKGHSKPASNKEPDNKPTEPETTQAEHQYIENAALAPLPYEGDFIVKLPYQTYLMAARGKPYLIEGSIGKAITNGKIAFGYTNYVIVHDLKASGNKVEKYYVSPLISKGAVFDVEAQFSSTDFSTFIQRESGKTPTIPAIFNRLNNTRNLEIMGVVLQDNKVIDNRETNYEIKSQVSAIKNEFTASPELAKEAFGQVNKLISEGKKQEASDKLAALNEAAFALLPFDKKIEYLELLTDVWTWQAQEKAIVEIFKSVDSIEDLREIKKRLKSKKIWEKMFADLNHEYWSLLVVIGMKFSSTPYTLAEFKTLIWEQIRNVSVIGVFINSNGEPEVIPEALKEIEQAIRGGIDFLEGIWDAIVMFVTHPDKIVEGVGQMMNLILNLQLAQHGYPPAIEYVDKVFGQISKQVVAAVRGLAIMEAEDIVIKKVKWALIWEVASWFVGVGEIKAALKSVTISGITEKLTAVTRVLSRAAGFTKLTIKEAELVNRFERLVVVMMKESKIIKSEEEAMTLLSKLSSNELEKVILALQKSEIPEGASLMQLAKETPELEGLVKKLESMQKLASADKKVAMTEKEIGNLQKLVNEESDPLFQKLLDKEEQIFNEKVRQPGNVLNVVEKEFKEAYDVEVKIGDHTYRRSIEDGTWCRFTKRKCNLKLDNSAVNKQKPINLPPPKLSEFDAGTVVKNQFPANDWEMHPLFQQGQPVKKNKGMNPLLSSEPEWYSKSLNAAVEVKRKDFIASLHSVDWNAITRQLEQRIHAMPPGTKNWIVFDIRRQGEAVSLAESISTKLSSKWDEIFFLSDNGTLKIVGRKAIPFP